MIPYTPQEIIDLTNQYRVEIKLPALNTNFALMKAALERATELSQSTNWSHETKGLNYFQLMDKVGYKRQYAGENLARGFNTAKDAMDALKKSPTHNANLIKSNYQDTGVAVVKGVDGQYYAVQLFGNQIPNKVPKTTPKVIPKRPQIDLAEIKRLQEESIRANSTKGLIKETIRGIPQATKQILSKLKINKK